MSNNNFYVYEHWRLDRDECFYVGKGNRRRAFDMKYRNAHHKAIQAKVTREGSAIEVRMVATGMAEDEAFSLECERICFWRAAGVDLANHTNGGEGRSGFLVSDETKMKQSAAAIQRNKNPEYIAKLRIATTKTWATNPIILERMIEAGKARRGIPTRPCSEETKLKIGLSNKGKSRAPVSLETRNKISIASKGRHVSAEVAKKISDAKKGVSFSDSHKEKLKKAWESRPRLEKKGKPPRVVSGPVDSLGRSKAGPMKNAKSVVCLTDCNAVFPSASDAARFYNINKTAIMQLCNGKKYRKSAGGHVFKYVEEV